MNPYTTDRTDPVPDFEDAPGTHGELIELPVRLRDELCDFAQDLLHKLGEEAA